MLFGWVLVKHLRFDTLTHETIREKNICNMYIPIKCSLSIFIHFYIRLMSAKIIIGITLCQFDANQFNI